MNELTVANGRFASGRIWCGILWIGLFLACVSAHSAATNFFLPKNPIAAAYVLGRLSNQELVEAPRSEFVYAALLQRKGLDRKYRLEALNGLAEIRHTDRLAELIRATGELDSKGEESIASLRDLAGLLLQSKPEELAAKRGALSEIRIQAQLPVTRQIAFGALATADRSLNKLWESTQPDQLPDLVLSIPWIRDPALRAAVYPKLESLLDKGDNPELRHAAILAIGSSPEHEQDTFRKLAGFLKTDIERVAVIDSLQRIPKKTWPADLAPSLVDHLLADLEKVPPNQRTEPDFAAAVQFASELASLLPPERGRALTKTLRGLGIPVIVIRAIYEQMLFDKQSIVAEAGKLLEIVLENQDAMPHNLVVVRPGALEEIGVAAEKMPPMADAHGRTYVPDSPKVLQSTPLVQPGEKAKLSLTAPAEPGDYPYLCSFPGHWRRMTGTLVVVKDIDAYLASHAAPVEPVMTEWKLSELALALPKLKAGRNLAVGKELFTRLACVQCHTLGKEGYAYGPDLTDVFQRWKGDPASVLEQILEPSKVIADRYRNYHFELKNGDELMGMIVKEDPQTLTIQSGPSDALIQSVKKSEIKLQQAQSSSVMPLGLLSSLSKEQILDLLAYLQAGGRIAPSEHDHCMLKMPLPTAWSPRSWRPPGRDLWMIARNIARTRGKNV